MVDASQVFLATVPAGSGSAATTAFPTTLVPSKVRRILITFPYGCAGLVGAQVQAAGGYAFPNQQNTFIVFDDLVYTFEVNNQVDSGQWSVVAYNQDVIPHTLQIVYEYDYLKNNSQVSSLTPVAL